MRFACPVCRTYKITDNTERRLASSHEALKGPLSEQARATPDGLILEIRTKLYKCDDGTVQVRIVPSYESLQAHRGS